MNAGLSLRADIEIGNEMVYIVCCVVVVLIRCVVSGRVRELRIFS